MKAAALSILFSILILSNLRAQEPKPAPVFTKPTSPVVSAPRGPFTLQQQFNSMKYRSSSHQEFNHDYKVVRVSYLDNFWQQVQDSLRARERNIRQAGKATAKSLQEAQKTVAAQENLLKTLKQENAQKEQKLQQTAQNIASLSVFGLTMDKQVYVILSWIVIVGLLVLAGIFAFLFNKSKRITDEKISAYDEVSRELKEHKQSARDREIKIKRDLQTESNKVEELNQQIAQLKKQVSL